MLTPERQAVLPLLPRHTIEAVVGVYCEHRVQGCSPEFDLLLALVPTLGSQLHHAAVTAFPTMTAADRDWTAFPTMTAADWDWTAFPTVTAADWDEGVAIANCDLAIRHELSLAIMHALAGPANRCNFEHQIGQRSVVDPCAATCSLGGHVLPACPGVHKPLDAPPYSNRWI